MAKKPANKLTDKELLRRLFPKEIRNALKRTISELDRRKQAGRKRKTR